MSYVLIGSYTSPIVRKIRLLCFNRIEVDFKAINYTEEPGNQYLKSINPINKYPVLIDGEQKIFESRVIFNYLSRKHGWKPLTLDEENILSAIDSANDVCVNLFLFRRQGTEIPSDNWYLQRQRERVPSIMDYLKPWIKSRDPENPDHWNYPSMALYTFLCWAKFRGAMSLEDRPECETFLKNFQNMPGIAETEIPR